MGDFSVNGILANRFEHGGRINNNEGSQPVRHAIAQGLKKSGISPSEVRDMMSGPIKFTERTGLKDLLPGEHADLTFSNGKTLSNLSLSDFTVETLPSQTGGNKATIGGGIINKNTVGGLWHKGN